MLHVHACVINIRMKLYARIGTVNIYIYDHEQVIKDLTDGGADYCFECIGLASVMQEAFSSCREVLSLSQIDNINWIQEH